MHLPNTNFSEHIQYLAFGILLNFIGCLGRGAILICMWCVFSTCLVR